jgi:hypothetical protein
VGQRVRSHAGAGRLYQLLQPGGQCYDFKSLYPGEIRSHDPWLQFPRWQMGDNSTRPRRPKPRVDLKIIIFGDFNSFSAKKRGFQHML